MMIRLALIAALGALALGITGSASARSSCLICVVSRDTAQILNSFPPLVSYGPCVVCNFSYGPFTDSDKDMCHEHGGVARTYDVEGTDADGNYFYVHVIECNDGTEIYIDTVLQIEPGKPTGPDLNNQPALTPAPAPSLMNIAPLVIDNPVPASSPDPGYVASDPGAPPPDNSIGDVSGSGSDLEDRCQEFWDTGSNDPGGC